MLMNDPFFSTSGVSLRARLSDTLAVVITVYFLNFASRSVSRPGRPYPPKDDRMIGLSVGILSGLQTSSRVFVDWRAMNGMSFTFEKVSNPPDIGSRSAIEAFA